MKRILMAAFSVALLMGIAAAQDSSTPAAPSSEPQTSAPATAPQTQEPAAQPQTQPPTTESHAPAPPSSAAPSHTPAAGTTSASGNAVRRIAPGSVIPVLLTKTIDAKKAKTGDEVVAKVTQDLKTNSGELIVAKDTKVMGHVTTAQPHSKEQKESQVGIAFDRAVEKNGNEMQLPMSIQAIIGPQNNQGAGNNEAAPASSAPAAGGNGRSAGTAGTSPAATPPPSAGTGTESTDSQAPARAPITAQTQGVVGISNLKLEPASQNGSQGSVVSSDKNNVKLESGTMMLLRVNQ
jgi:hypothetical protein